ncbi:PE family protein [Mycobacterium xenopi 4042]|uniref:PE family protein n=1 Tax=Mycobacterium xenopi 4042 TaxID=1299334 RepID=X8CG64_MYCXE|nr:PE family protein [Mycobacterium xenopi 4042]
MWCRARWWANWRQTNAMSFVVTTPEMLAAASGDLQRIGTALSAGNAAPPLRQRVCWRLRPIRCRRAPPQFSPDTPGSIRLSAHKLRRSTVSSSKR